LDEILIVNNFEPQGSVQRFSGFFIGMDLAFAKILGTDDLFQAPGKWLCDFWWWVG
jgi:hypothetical protein